MAILTPISLKRGRSSSYGGYVTPAKVARQLFNSAVHSGVKYAADRATSYVKNRVSGTKSAVATTTQHDVSRQYRYKRMPRRKRRRWVKALKKNQAMDMAESATQTVHYNNVLEGRLDHVINGRTQNFIAVHMYGMNGQHPAPVNFTQETGTRDISVIREADKHFKDQLNTRVKFESAVLDMTVKNPNANNGLEVDIYEVVYRSGTKYTSLTSLHEDLDFQTPSNQNPASANDRAQWWVRGITPFDTVQFGASGAKILSKKKVFLPPGNTFTYQYRDPKNHYFGPDDFHDSTGFIGKHTRTVLLVYKSITGEPLPTGTGNELRLFVGLTRIYKYKVKGNTESGIIVG